MTSPAGAPDASQDDKAPPHVSPAPTNGAVTRRQAPKIARQRRAKVPQTATVEAQLAPLTPELFDALVEIVADALVVAHQRDGGRTVGSPQGLDRGANE
jgi:hypothetical protein